TVVGSLHRQDEYPEAQQCQKAGFHHWNLNFCVILRLTSLAPTPDKEISVGCDKQTKEDKCVSHTYSCYSASLDAASFALLEEKKPKSSLPDD
ncbi:MAG: hypothetical protein P8L39_03685, partial [Halioglobus sp.]|nr:hypothetical protein [Halioglobus sp.]